MFERELQYYNSHKEQLSEKYLGKHIVIAEDQVIGVYTDISKKIPPDSFMIREIPENIEDEVQYLSPFLVTQA